MHTRARTVGKICEIFDLAAQIFSTLSRAAFRLGHTLQFRICKWVRLNKWVNEWVNVCMNGKSANLHNNSNGKQTLSAETRQVASGYEVTKSSCSRCTFTRREEETEREEVLRGSQREGERAEGYTERNLWDWGFKRDREGRTAKSYWAAATVSAILFQLAFATSENAQKMENYARCCRVAKWQAEQAATWRLADLVSMYFHCQNRKQVKIVRQKSIVDILSLSNLISSLSLQLQQAQTEYQITNKCICSYSSDCVCNSDCIFSCGKYLQLRLWLYLQLLK